MAALDSYLAHLVSQSGSDLHLSAGERVRIRVDGDLVEISDEALEAPILQQLLFEILEENEQHRFVQEKNLDKAYSLEGYGNFRLNIFLTRRGIACVARSIPSKIPTLMDLGMPETVERLTEVEKGLILVTGATGSGKSTTLAAMLNHINWHEPGHILTIEDPIEFVHESKRSLINQRQIGQSCHSFADALKYALREDPDVILVGEMRDTETISLALTAAETGHLVFGTLHTRGAASSIDRIIDSFTAEQQPMIRTMLSESLVAVVSQQLVKRATGRGRVAAYEILVVNQAVSNLIREGKSFQIPSVMQTGRREGMIVMDQHLRDLMAASVITAEEGEKYLSESATRQAKKNAASMPVARPAGAQPNSVPNQASAPKNFVPEQMSDKTAIIQMPSLATVGRRAQVQAPAQAAAPVQVRPKPAAPKAPAVAPPPMRSATPAAAPAPAGFAPLATNEPKEGPRAKPNPPPKPMPPKAAPARPATPSANSSASAGVLTDLISNPDMPAEEVEADDEYTQLAEGGLVDLTTSEDIAEAQYPPRKKIG